MLNYSLLLLKNSLFGRAWFLRKWLLGKRLLGARPLTFLFVSCSVVVFSESVSAETQSRKSLFDIAKVERASAETVGKAKDFATEKVLYTEYHYSRLVDGVHYVIYRDVAGELIAEKKLIFSDQVKRPELEQYNYLSGESVLIAEKAEANVEKKEHASLFVVQYQESFTSKQQREFIANQPDLVIDSGFAFLINEHWDALKNGKSIRFDYLAPSRQRAFDFTLQRIDCGDGNNNSENSSSNNSNNGERCFQIAPQSWWLQRFLAPIDLTYDVATKRLIKYAGLGNIADASGDYMKVVIDYSYPD